MIVDHSPYFVKYQDSHVAEVIAQCREFHELWQQTRPGEFQHIPLNPEQTLAVLAVIPWRSVIDIWQDRVSLFVLGAGGYYRPHKDGGSITAGVNYVIDCAHSASRTNWYADSELAEWQPNPHWQQQGWSRECLEFTDQDRHRIQPEYTTVFHSGDCVLFNTDRYHDFENSSRTRPRVVLTIRSRLGNDYEFAEWQRRLDSVMGQGPAAVI